MNHEKHALCKVTRLGLTETFLSIVATCLSEKGMSVPIRQFTFPLYTHWLTIGAFPSFIKIYKLGSFDYVCLDKTGQCL